MQIEKCNLKGDCRPRARPPGCGCAFLLAALFVGGAAVPAQADEPEETPTEEPAGDDEPPLPTIDKMELPSFQRLMKGPPVDWIVMHSKKVLEVEPLYPRPGTLDDIDQKIRKATRKVGDPPESETAKRKRLALSYLPITLMEGEERDYKLHIKFIKEIVYYDDLMLKRVDQLLDDRKVRQAYELLTALEERQESWPGVVPRKERLLFVEAAVRLDERQPQHALALLEALHERNREYAGLEAEFGTVGDRLISAALESDDPRAARYFLRRIARRFPNHKVVKDGTARMMQSTRELLAQAAAAERAGQVEVALDAAERAARVWPELPEVLPVYNRLAGRFQRLRAGVVDLPGAAPERAPVLLASAERRRRGLTETPLFQPARFEKEARLVRYETRFFNEWEPTELGHSVLFRLRPWRAAGESLSLVTAASLAGTLGRRLDPRGAWYDARFAAAVESLEVRSPFEMLVRFRQVPLRPEALFAFVPPPASSDDRSAFESDADPAASHAGAPPDTWPFELQSVDDRRAVYRRTTPEPESSADRHVAEVVEVGYESHEKVIQGLLRGEVSFVPRVPASAVRSLSDRSEFFSQRYALPTTHVLQFNPHCRALSARTVRRALVYALDRRRILEEVFLHEAAGRLGRQTSAPWPTASYAYSRRRDVEPHKYDPPLAFSLAKSAEKEMGGKLPVLKLLSSAEPEVQAAVRLLVEQWRAAGMEVQPAVAPAAALPEDGAGDWDILYRTETIAEPLVELWPFLALTASTETSALGHLPTWLRQELLDLDRVGDWERAERLLHRLHKQFWAEVHLIPLWEIDDVMVYRKNIRGVPERPAGPYQRIERWKIEPWYARESPL
ncbi:MAG: ABC transporter substrate-binding protein [Deltaproteobacteria bacterium]